MGMYKAQAVLLLRLLKAHIRHFRARAPDRKFRVCETGFGSGHSAILWLSADANVEVVSFDLFKIPHQEATLKAVNAMFPGRLETVRGDSCEMVGQYTGHCDFVHASSYCELDAVYLTQNANGMSGGNAEDSVSGGAKTQVACGPGGSVVPA